MVYLQPAEYALFGLGPDTLDAWITTASALIDSWCRRPTLGAASYTERLRVGRRSGSVRLSYGLIVSVDSLQGRFSAACAADDDMLAAIGSLFCQPGSWTTINVAGLDVVTTTGELAVPANLLGGRYSEVEVMYTAGFTDIPVPVKAACAQLVKNMSTTPGLNVKSSHVDSMAMEYFGGSLMTADICQMLQPFRAERLGA